MQGNARIRGERDEKLLGKRGVELPQQAQRHIHIPVQLAAARDVHRGKHQRLVHGKVLGSEAVYAALFAHGLGKRLAKHYAHVFDGMVGVHFDIALCLHVQAEQAMPAERIQHMVEESNAGVDVGCANPIDIQLKADIGFLGGARDVRAAVSCHQVYPRSFRIWANAARNCLFSSGEPTDTRRQSVRYCACEKSRTSTPRLYSCSHTLSAPSTRNST